MRLDLYGDSSGGPALLVHPEDEGRVDAEAWEGILVPSEHVERGVVQFARVEVGADKLDIRVDEDDPTMIRFETEVRITGMGARAKIGDGNLIFEFVATGGSNGTLDHERPADVDGEG